MNERERKTGRVAELIYFYNSPSTCNVATLEWMEPNYLANLKIEFEGEVGGSKFPQGINQWFSRCNDDKSFPISNLKLASSPSNSRGAP